VIHIMPSASERNRKCIFFKKELCKSKIKIFFHFHKSMSLVPPVLTIQVIVCPTESMVMECKLITPKLYFIAVIFFHKIKSHCIANGHISINCITEHISAYHPPCHL